MLSFENKLIFNNLKELLTTILELKHGKREALSLVKVYFQDKEFPKGASEQELKRIVLADVELLREDFPIQYITEKAFFYDSLYKVSPDVLIPRPETEELVHRIINNHKNEKKLKILDIGTGSGCIALTLAKQLTDSIIHALDTSESAISIARENSELHDLKVSFVKFNFLDKSKWFELTVPDIIVSNPPYVRKSEREVMSTSTIKFEPVDALIPDHEDPLIFYKTISEYATLYMENNSMVYVEINEYLANETLHVFLDANFTARLINDMQGKPRIIEARVKK